MNRHKELEIEFKCKFYLLHYSDIIGEFEETCIFHHNIIEAYLKLIDESNKKYKNNYLIELEKTKQEQEKTKQEIEKTKQEEIKLLTSNNKIKILQLELKILKITNDLKR